MIRDFDPSGDGVRESHHDHDHEFRGLKRPEINVRDIEPRTNDRGERLTRMVFDFNLTFGRIAGGDHVRGINA